MSQDHIAKLMALAANVPSSDGPQHGADGRDSELSTERTAPSLAEQLRGRPDADDGRLLPPPLTNAAGPVETSPFPPAGGEPPPRRVARRRPAGPVRGRLAANDDVPSIGGLIYALEQKPSAKPFRIAAIASAIWAGIGVSFGALTLAQQATSESTIASLLLNPFTFYTAAAVLVPIAIVWLLALLNWHIASLALRSSTMTEVAIRLAEPDRAAEQSIASLGQAVRRQVSFMNDAVTRALGRAGELEALVHNQVADLERSYEANERRIRNLIQELAGERHALLNTSTGVTDTLKTLGTEIPTLIEKLSTQQLTLAEIVKGAGDNLAALEGSLAASTGRFEQAVGSRAHQLQSVLEDYTTAFSTALGSRTEQMRLAFDGYMEALDTSLGNRTENLQTVFEEYARALDTTLSNRAKALDEQLIERTRSLDDAFQARLQLFDDQIHRSTNAIDTAVNEKAMLLTSALETHARTFRETMERQAGDLDDTVMTGINAVHRASENITRQTMKAIEGLNQQSNMLQHVADNMFTQINGVTNRFENQGEQILRVANQLDSANLRIDSTLQSRHAEMARTLDQLTGKADEFGRTLAGYSSTLEGSLGDIEVRARAIAEELRDGAQSRSKALIAELDRVRLQTEAESERTLADLKNRFQSVSGELSREFETLSTGLSSASDEARLRAAEAAQNLAKEQARLRDEAARLPISTRESAEAMRRALQDQMRALEQLAHISQRAKSSRDVVAPDPLLAQSPAPARALPTLSASLRQETANSIARSAAAAGDARENWKLGDLLARASHDDEPAIAATPARDNRPAVDPSKPFRLDVAAISRSIDAATASNIWSRLRAGQRNVMVRSIYTNEARALFDELSTRVKVDGELAQTVLRYLSDFERIIRDADARDPSGRLTHTHLVSDTGRVYLFLAHAVGRVT